MSIKDLHVLPKIKDSQSFVYAEHCKIDQDDKSIAFHDVDGKTQVPCSNLTTLLVGPGTSITHAAVRTLGLETHKREKSSIGFLINYYIC